MLNGFNPMWKRGLENWIDEEIITFEQKKVDL